MYLYRDSQFVLAYLKNVSNTHFSENLYKYLLSYLNLGFMMLIKS